MFAWLKRKYGRKTCLLEREPTQGEINSACLYMDHSFGLMDKKQQERLAWEAAEWLYAWHKVEEDNHRLSK